MPGCFHSLNMGSESACLLGSLPLGLGDSPQPLLSLLLSLSLKVKHLIKLQAFYFIFLYVLYVTIINFFCHLAWHLRSYLRPLQWKHAVLTTGPPGKSLKLQVF